MTTDQTSYDRFMAGAVRIYALAPGDRFRCLSGIAWTFERHGDNRLMVWARNVSTDYLHCFARTAYVRTEPQP